jgi:hypothetical protein
MMTVNDCQPTVNRLLSKFVNSPSASIWNLNHNWSSIIDSSSSRCRTVKQYVKACTRARAHVCIHFENLTVVRT